MKYLIVFATFLAFVWAAPSNPCACEPPTCPGTAAVACVCRNIAATECWDRKTAQGITCPEPTIQDCFDLFPDLSFTRLTLPTTTTPEPTPEPTTEPTSEPTAEPTPEPPCVCDTPICSQPWPEDCVCRNLAALSCYHKCGGPMPEEETCFEPPPDLCVCEERVCPQSWPDSCICENAAREACYQKCGGFPPVQELCFDTDGPFLPQRCGGLTPFPVDCPAGQVCVDDPQVIAAGGCGMACDMSGICVDAGETPPPPPPQSCGGWTLDPQQCLSGQVCIDDPQIIAGGGCGMACDMPGICVDAGRICGGIGGLECSAGQTCVDDPLSGCSMSWGHPDCTGICA